MEIGNTPSRSHVVLHHTPEAFERIKGRATMGWEQREAHLAVLVVQGRIKLMCPMHPAAIHAPHTVLTGVAEGGHPLLEIVA